MFTGIVECVTKVHDICYDKNNMHITLNNPFYEIKINQSISHNGICLTVANININEKTYSVIASEETLSCTNLKLLKIKDEVNLERSLIIHKRLDGHIVQGHIDTTAKIVKIKNRNGSWLFFFETRKKITNFVVEKGSIAINGISLTIIKFFNEYLFHVSIIPYTYEKTNLKLLRIGNIVNIEFDVIGKYINNYVKNIKK